MSPSKNYILDAKIVINSSYRASWHYFSLNLAYHSVDLYIDYVVGELSIQFGVSVWCIESGNRTMMVLRS